MNKDPEVRHVLSLYRYDGLGRIAVVNIEAQDSVSRFYQQSRLMVEVQGRAHRNVFEEVARML